ncbi:hypothetical protein [Escherichia coli]
MPKLYSRPACMWMLSRSCMNNCRKVGRSGENQNVVFFFDEDAYC